MKRKIPSIICTVLTLLVALAALFPAGALAQVWGSPIAGETTPVDQRPGEQTDPHISGALVAYTSDLNGSSEIRYHDLLTGAGMAIPTDGNQDLLADVSDDTIIYTRFFHNGHSGIFRYNAGTSGPAIELDSQPASARQNAAIGNQTVAWEDYSFVSDTTVKPEIVAFDLSTTVATRITDDQLPDVDPAISADGSVIVWSKCQPTGTVCDIWQASRSGSGWAALQLTGTAGNDTSSDTNGQVAIYQSNSGGNLDIFWQPVSGGVEQQLALPDIQRNPNISGNLAAFESQSATTGNFDIVIYDLARDKLYQVTNTSSLSEQLNDISVAPDGLVRVVWSSLGQNGDFDLHARSFRLPASDSTPPTITIVAPTNTVYTLNQTVLADYVCADEQSGVATCAGSVPRGSLIDTATVGIKNFTVTATDQAGNSASRPVSYTVAYDICVLIQLARDAESGQPLPPDLVNDLRNAISNGTPIPILFQRCDRAGGPRVLVVAQIDKQQTDVQRGIYVMRFKVAGVTYTVKFRVR